MKKLTPNNLRSEFAKFLKKWLIEICILAILFICFLLGDKFEKNFAAVGSIGSVLISYAAYRISKRQEKSNEISIKSNISDEKRKFIKEHFQKTLDAIAKTSNYWNWRKFNNDPQGKSDSTLEILALSQIAKIELNDDFANLIEKIYLFYCDLASQLLEAAEKNIALGAKALENHKKESALRRDLESLYAKYLNIPTL